MSKARSNSTIIGDRGQFCSRLHVVTGICARPDPGRTIISQPLPTEGETVLHTTSRRFLILGGTLALTAVAHAQPSASPFVGRWTGHVRGLGDAEIIVVAVRANGQVDGTMVFPEQAKTFAFGDKLDLVNSINHGLVQGSSLTIETALGGTYHLTLAGGQLAGEYVRGNTYKVPVTFQKAM